MAETDAVAVIHVAVDHTGRALRLIGSDLKHVRDQLSEAGVRFRLRGEEGAVVADAWEGVALRASGLALDWSPEALRLAANRAAVAAALPHVAAAYDDIRAGGPAF